LRGRTRAARRWFHFGYPKIEFKFVSASRLFFRSLPRRLRRLNLGGSEFASLPEDFFRLRPSLAVGTLGEGFTHPPQSVIAQGRGAIEAYFEAKGVDGTEALSKVRMMCQPQADSESCFRSGAPSRTFLRSRQWRQVGRSLHAAEEGSTRSLPLAHLPRVRGRVGGCGGMAKRSCGASARSSRRGGVGPDLRLLGPPPPPTPPPSGCGGDVKTGLTSLASLPNESDRGSPLAVG
jgi:hypothetical protein